MIATQNEEAFSGYLQPYGDGGWRDAAFRIIFESDTPLGKLFDLGLLAVILLNLFAICMETVEPWDHQYATLWVIIEWACTILFTIEFLTRSLCVKRPHRYIFSFYGLIDFLSIMPAYVSVGFGVNAQSFAVLRSFRLLRVFRVLKLHWLTTESESLWSAVWQARAKIVVFVSVVLVAVTIAGTVMYEIEGRPAENDAVAAATSRQFDSIPSSIYWAIVTMTTVGYGDIVPQTALGKAVSSILILLGYSLIIVPTGFVSAEFSKQSQRESELACSLCSDVTHDADAKFCKHCGQRLVRQVVDQPESETG